MATSRADLTAAEISAHTRRHWGIENLEHRPRDTVWREDDQQLVDRVLAETQHFCAVAGEPGALARLVRHRKYRRRREARSGIRHATKNSWHGGPGSSVLRGVAP
ncbi:MAG TPA: hypothetical protein VGJ54_16125 [Streptosporangiaceae bacterium]